MRLKCTSLPGDTIVEVMLAITIFSAVAIGGLTIMNQGTAAAQRSLEMTLVRQEIDGQAESLRVMHNEMITQKNSDGSGSPIVARWDDMMTKMRVPIDELTPMSDSVSKDETECRFPTTGKVFVIDPVTLSVKKGVPRQPDTFSQIRYGSGGEVTSVDGLWIEAVRGSGSPVSHTPGYTDFYIRACWSAVGQSRPATISSVVRLYEPRS